MKLSPQRVDAFLRHPDSAVRAILLYGPDGGLVRERALSLCRTVLPDLTDPFRVAELSGEQVERDPARLADEAAAQAMTGGRRLIRVRGAGDATAASFTAWFASRPPGDSLVVVESGELDARSKLRAAFESADIAAAIACYPEDEKDVSRTVAEQLKTAGLSASPDALALLAAHLVGDRMIARTEVDKLIVYMGVGLGGSTPVQGGRRVVEIEDVRATIGDSAENDLDDPIWAAADGDYAATDRAVMKLLAAGESPVAILRAAQRHLQRLELAAARVAAGEPLDAVGRSLWSAIFFKLRPRVDRQLKLWDAARLSRALDRLLEAEAECKRTHWPDQTICARSFFQVAQMATRSGTNSRGR